MAIDILNGVGRIPRSGLVQVGVSNSGAHTLGSSATPVSTSASVTIPGGTQASSIAITVLGRNSNGTTGTATNPKVSVYTNGGELIAQYGLPLSSADSFGVFVNDIVPVNRQFWGGNETLIVTLSADTVGGNGYSVGFGATLLGIAI